MIERGHIRDSVRKLQEQNKGKKKNITFRLSERVVVDYKKACQRHKVAPGAMIAELMEIFARHEG